MSGLKDNGEHTCEGLYVTMSSIADGVISVNKEKNIVFINQAAQNLTGWNEAEAINQPLDPVFNIIDAKTRMKANCLFTQVLNTGEKASFRNYPALISKSGSEKYISVKASPIKHKDGEVSGVVIIFHDVTGYKQIEEELKIERNNLKTQFQYAPVGMVIVDENAVIQSANDHFIDMFENLKDNVIGKKIGKSMGCVGAINSICCEDEKCKCYIKECIINVVKSRIPFRDVENHCKLVQSGKTISRNLKFNLVPINISGKTNVLISVDDMTEYRVMEENLIRDITKHKKTEQALRDSEEKFRAIFQNAPYAIFVNELPKAVLPHIHNNFIEVNGTACSLLGYSREELLEMCPCEIVYGDFNDKSPDEIKQLFTNGHMSYETFYKTRDGRKIPVEFNAHTFELSGRKVILTIANDISERKQTELETLRAMEATNAAYKTKSEFLANMSHEIRTPLNGIIGMLDLTMLTDLPNDQMDNLSTAKTCANSLLKIINDVLDFSKMEAGKMAIVHVEFNFKVLIEKIAKVHYYRAKEKGIELTYQLPADLPPVLIGDPDRLQQVLNNLLSNAVKFTDRGSVNMIVKTINCMDDFVKLQFSVVDTGIGISDEEMSKLFKSFSQIDGSQTRKFGGTGLGLVISRQLVEMMGGNLKVESEKEKGSLFSFVLRFEVGGISRTVAKSTEWDGIGKTKTNARILLVEDDKVNQMVISRMLMEMGYKFDAADCGSEALRLLEHKNYDLCLMDIHMPGLDGVQTVGIIRQNEQNEGKHMPIIAITAYALQGDRERFLTMGMDEYLAKPFQMSELFILLEKLLAEKAEKNDTAFTGNSSGKSANIEELNSYIKNYVHEIQPVINKIRICIERLNIIIKSENMQETEEIAHDIKTLASSISAEKVKTLAFRIELAARRSNRLEADELHEELDAVFKRYTTNINETEVIL